MLGAVQHAPGATPVMERMAEPFPRKGEVLIHVRTAALGGQDIVGAYRDEMRYPCVVRGEGVGVDDRGRRVYFGERSRLPYGAFAPQTVVPKEEVWTVPDDVCDRLAITMGISGTGAWGPLNAARIQKGDAVLVTGATGAVGQLALQFARHLGAGRLVGAGRNRKALEGLVERGIADAIAVLGEGDDLAALKAQSGGHGYDVALDVLYGPYFTLAAKATRPGARIVTLGAQAGIITPVAAPDILYRWHTSWGTGQAAPQDREKTWRELLDLARKGVDVNYREFTFDQVVEAYEAQRAVPHGKVVVTMQ